MTTSTVRVAASVGYNRGHTTRHRIKEALDVSLGYSSQYGFHMLPKMIWCGSGWCILDKSLRKQESQGKRRNKRLEAFHSAVNGVEWQWYNNMGVIGPVVPLFPPASSDDRSASELHGFVQHVDGFSEG
ncbi:hypothetical protein TNCV_1490601 [Trichonephila clavipes]|nr:hypothetical protein TNCV_1490601 [Trichonephila clavipes]